jgi:hypothetical protein
VRTTVALALVVSCVVASCGFDGPGEAEPTLEASAADGSIGVSDAAERDAHAQAPDARVGVDASSDAMLDTGAPDGAIAADAAFVCPAVCTGGCAAGSCRIVCTSGAKCAKVICPPGLPCVVNCTGNDACTQGVDCTQATSCSVKCDTSANPQDPGACRNVDCGGTTCAVTCTGEKACQQRLSCTGTTKCTFDCKTQSSCCSAPVCSGACTVGGVAQGVGGC